MLELKMVEFTENAIEKINGEYHHENEPLCWGRTRGRNGIIQRYNDLCAIGRKYVNETEHHQEQLNYWWEHLEDYIKLHQHSFDVGDMDINDPLKKELDYYTMKVQLLEDGIVIKEEIFRYGR